MIYMEIDVMIFKNYFMPILEIDTRYVGDEPKDPMTAMYNEMMKKILKDNLKNIKAYHLRKHHH